MGDFVLVFPDAAPASRVASDALRNCAHGAGLTVADFGPVGWTATGGRRPPRLTEVGAWTLIGDVIHRSRPTFDTGSADRLDYERKLLRRFWGRFVGVRLAASGQPAAVMRDPSGALEAMTWRQDGLTLIVSSAYPWLIEALRPDWTIDLNRVKAALRDPVLASAGALLAGPTAVAPGAVLDLQTGTQTALWDPARFARSSLDSRMKTEEASETLTRAVDEAVTGLAGLGGRLAAEVSGGLDSSLIAASLLRAPVADPELWINSVGATLEADERLYVQALSATLGISPTFLPHATAPLTKEGLLSISQGFRPGLAALDIADDAAMGSYLEAAGIQAVMTGKGGDSILMQRATPDVFADVWKARGWRALAWPDAPRLAAFNEVSVWTMVRHALRPTPLFQADRSLLRPPSAPSPRHPWLEALEAFGPAKALQIAGVADVVSRHRPSPLTEIIDVRHPLCMPPVTEACLSIPSHLLVLGGRDRGLARHAFRDRLPALIADRRSKGDMTKIYGHMVLDNLGFLRPWLIDGRLADLGVIDPDAADRLLTPDHLLWRGGYGQILLAAAFEAWVRAWESRLHPRGPVRKQHSETRPARSG